MPVLYNERTTPLAKNSSNSAAASEVLSWDFTGMGSVAQGTAWLHAGASAPVLTLNGSFASRTYNGIPGIESSGGWYSLFTTTDYGLQVGDSADYTLGVVFSTGPTLPAAAQTITLAQIRSGAGASLVVLSIGADASGWWLNASGTAGIGFAGATTTYGVNKTLIFWARRRAGVLTILCQEVAPSGIITQRYESAANTSNWDSVNAGRIYLMLPGTGGTVNVALHQVRFWSGASFTDAETLTLGRDWWALDANSAAVNGLAITSPSASASVSVTTTISGTYTGTAPVGVQVQHGSASWVSLTSFVSGAGVWSGAAALSAASANTLRARYTEAPATVSADISGITVVSDSIAFTVPASTQYGAVPYRLFQRNGTNQASVQVEGTYSGTPTSLEYRWGTTGGWANLVTSPTGGVFSATVVLTGPGQEPLSVRFSNNTGCSASLPSIGVGDIYICAGQSNAAGWAGQYLPASPPAGHTAWVASEFDLQHVWRINQESALAPFYNLEGGFYPVFAPKAAAGSYYGALATVAMESGVPIAVIPCAKGGTSIDNWVASTTATTSLYGAMLATAQKIGAHRAILFWQGEAEMNPGSSPSTWAGKMSAIMSAWATAGQTSKWLLTQPCWAANGSTAEGTALRSAIASLSGSANVLAVVDLDSPSPAYDALHYTNTTQMTVIANRVALGLGYSGATSRYASITLTIDGSTPVVGASGLRWAFFDEVTPDVFSNPIAKGTGESTDATGALSVDITGTTLAPGSTGWLIVTNSDGTTTQSPSAKAFAGPVVVS